MRRRRILATVLALITALCIGVRPAFAADVTGNINKGVLVKANKMYTQTFEKKGDRDCFYFVSGGGSYKVVVYDLSGRPLEAYGTIEDYGSWKSFYPDFGVGIVTSYGEFEYFSAAGGAPAAWQVGSFMSNEGGVDVDFDTCETDFTTTMSMGTHKAGKCVALWFEGDYKGQYKFKVIGKAAAKSEIKKKSNPVKAKAKRASLKVKLSKVKKADVTLKSNIKIKKRGAGIVSFKNVSKKAKAKRLIVNPTNGKITIPKGTKKGKYSVKVKVLFSGDISHKQGSAVVKFKVVVK